MSQQKSPRKKPLNSYARFSGIAFQMVAIIGGGTYLGVYLDKKYPNKHAMYTVICALGSVLISIYFVVRQIIKMSKRNP
ncbi:Membrane protein [Croceitalea dokdonensis DOKDO 023]|uniref:Membrane protein n=1 Tax=Croceitalea dokdonensis DOKDO 023 TaxID=1300341 RepID=A0A0P7AXC5_9FLAO|nr:AtpZ/AtpI family protein [Croceitalea dokdonensis]KPM30987.1 Membrane protein [Croceitalea dokdonensis DOKDO 023]